MSVAGVMTGGSAVCLRPTTWLVILGVIFAQASEAQQGDSPAALLAPVESALPVLPIIGPPPPVPPEVIARDASGRATIRAVSLTAPLRVDGRLDEALYATVPPISGFVQIEPQQGSAATEKTDVWVAFDHERVYASFRCWESQPERVVAKEMRRDNSTIWTGDDIVAFMFDTFYDRRNAVLFTINSIGGRQDGQVTNENQWNPDWNPVWDVSVAKFEGGWAVEAAIPFKSLRYRPGQTQIWGFNVLRANRWRNELSFLTRMPPAQGQRALLQASLAATVVGLEVPAGARNLEIKPYAIAEFAGDRTTTSDLVNDLGGDLGLDVKYGVTQSLVADLTVNTDFAQVEADEQQVNLTRFSLFFPEKREFFLENQGLFAFGGAGAGAFGGGGVTPILFYSRQIGLNEGQEVPINAGGRLTGRVGKFSLGAMSLQTAETPAAAATATNFSVVRVRRDLLRRSNVGVLFAGRSVSKAGTGSNETYGVDGLFSFYDNLNVNTYWAKTSTVDRHEDDVSYRTQLDYAGDRYGLQLERLVVGDNFNPEVGFLRRDDFERSFGSFRFSPRLRSLAAVRKLRWEGRIDYITDRAGVLETREAQGQFGIEFENSDQFDVAYTRTYEFLEQPFPIASDVTIPVGGYGFQDIQASFALGSQRRLSGTFSFQHGSFFSGDKTTVGFTRGRLELTPQLSVEPSVSFNRVTLPEGRFSTQLVTTRTTYTMTPLMFVSALLQYNSSNNSVGANLRLRWEYQQGSELFVVYNEQRDTLTPRFPELANRAFVVKINRLFRF